MDKKISQDTIDYWSWICNSEYLKILNIYTHLPTKNRPYLELLLIHRMNELTWNIKKISFNSQIYRNITARMLSNNIPLPENRYYFYDFNNIDFSENRLNEIKKIEENYLKSVGAIKSFEVEGIIHV